MKHISIISAIAAFVAIGFTFNAGAQSSDAYVSLKKSITSYDYKTQTGTIALESYVTGASKTTTSSLVEADICMVLDYSSSMKDNKKNDMLQKAANDFVDQLASKSDATTYSRVGLIIFGTGARMKTDFLAVNVPANVTKLHGYINETCPAPNEGSTRYDLAFWIASNMIYGGTGGYVKNHNTTGYNTEREKLTDIDWGNATKNSYSGLITKSSAYGTGNTDPYPKIGISSSDPYKQYTKKASLSGPRSGKTPIIIFLTDGQPTMAGSSLGDFSDFYKTYSSGISTIDKPGYDIKSSDSNYDGNRYPTSFNSDSDAQAYSFGIANYAIKIAKDLKENKGVEIFSIHIDPNDNKLATFAGDCITAISSLYPHAERYRMKYWNAKNTNGKKYYQRIRSLDQSSISGAFTEITKSITSVQTLKYDSTTELRDFINNDYFKLPNGTTTSSIKVFTAPVTAVSSANVLTFGSRTQLTSGYSVEITPGTSSTNQKVTVKGFDYSDNWCGKDVNTGAIHGKKLIVEIPFTFSGINQPNGYGTFDTNGNGSGIYPPKDSPTSFDKPNVSFGAIKIVRQDLQLGESAVYTVKNKKGEIVATVTLVGTGTGDVSNYVYWLPADDYTVEETNWDWVYNKGTNPQTKTVGTTALVTYTFTGVKKSGEEPQKDYNHAEATVKNTFKGGNVTTSTSSNPHTK